MKCPRCTAETLDERIRENVSIDVCGVCRGIWLDRGELEKLIARSGEPAHFVYRNDGPPSSDDPRRRRKRSWMDIFD
jgi:Zn-finger nucleic acid-binding protein